MAKKARKRADNGVLPKPPLVVQGLECAAIAQESSINWLVQDAIPMGAITLVEGRKSTGKSSILAAIVASLTGGPVIPGWVGPRDGRAIWVASEDSWASVVVPRLRAAKADISRVYRVALSECMGRKRRMVLPDDLVILGDCLRDLGAAVLVLDPYISLAHPSLDVRIEQQARAYLEPLVELIDSLNVCSLLSRHLKKGLGGDTREAGLGSVAVANVARSVLRCDEHPHEDGRMVLSCVANNWGRKMATQVFHIVTTEGRLPFIEWDGVCDLDADTISEGRGTAVERDEAVDADTLITSLIGMESARSSVIRQEAEDAGISWITVKRAKKRLGVQSRRVTSAGVAHWQWIPPKLGWPVGLGVLGPNGGGTRAREPLDTLDTLKPPKTRRNNASGSRGSRAHACPPKGIKTAKQGDGNGETATSGLSDASATDFPPESPPADELAPDS